VTLDNPDFYVFGLELIPGGTGIVYSTGNTSSDCILYSVLVPNHPLSLGGNPPMNQGTLGTAPLVFTPDGKRVVFLGDLNTDGGNELYSAPVDASQPARRLNPALSGSLDVSFQYLISPDGKRVLYRADQSADEVF